MRSSRDGLEKGGQEKKHRMDSREQPTGEGLEKNTRRTREFRSVPDPEAGGEGRQEGHGRCCMSLHRVKRKS